jgi:hypothetical protein
VNTVLRSGSGPSSITHVKEPTTHFESARGTAKLTFGRTNPLPTLACGASRVDRPWHSTQNVAGGGPCATEIYRNACPGSMSWVRRRRSELFGLIGAILVAVLMATSPQAVVRSHSVPKVAFSGQTTPSASTFRNYTSSEVSAIYEFFRGNTSANVASFLPQSSVVTRTLSMLASIMNDSAFLSAYDSNSSANFTIQMNCDATSGISVVSFVEAWVDGSLTYQEYWTGYVSNSTVLGPVTVAHPRIQAAAWIHDSTNWAGWDFDAPSDPYGTTLHSNGADATVATVSVPSQSPSGVPSGTSIYPVMTAWTSLSPHADGTGGLLQTGYDAVPSSGSGTTYSLWWEFYPINSQQSYVNSYSISAGNILRELEFNNGTDYTLEVYDYSNSKGVFAQINANSYYTGWTPTNGAAIVEAYSTYESGSSCPGYNCIQQIADFSNVEFEDGLLWENDGPGSYAIYNYTQLYNFNDVGIYQLQQSQSCFLGICSGVDSTNQNYQSAWAWDYAYYGYPQVSWVTSSFQFSYVD